MLRKYLKPITMRSMKRWLIAAGLSSLLLSLTVGCSAQNESSSELTIYSGRSEDFISPFLATWQDNSGVKLNIRYGDSAELAAQILEEGKNSPADIFLAQDAGSLGAISAAGLFTQIANDVATLIPNQYIAENREWVGLTARVRVFAYDPNKIKTLPLSISDLTKPIYKNQLAIAPTNASFQAFVTAMINSNGIDFSRNWLAAIKANGVKIYAKNTAIVEAIDKGEVSIGLVNHYYTWEVSESLGREINVLNGFFAAGDIGNLINVSGIGILKSSDKVDLAKGLIDFLASTETQKKFVSDTHEYSLIDNQSAPTGLPTLAEIGSPNVDLGLLKDVKTTQDLLIEVGLL